MTQKYLSDEERDEIKKLYLTGKYTLVQLGKKYFVSKGTIINTLKDYPYTTDKVTFWRRVYRGIVRNMDIALEDIRQEILDCLVKHDNVNYSTLMRQEQYLLDFAKISPEELFQTLRQERLNLEQAGWGHIAQEDYKEFAYCQSLWRRINFIIGDNQKFPWGGLPEKVGAKSRANSVKYYSNKDSKEIRHYCRNVTVNSINISKNLYNEVSNTIISPTGRIHKNPLKRLTDILNLFLSGESLKQHRDWRKIYESYDTWYRSGVFRILWELNEKYPELEPIRPALLYIERHRLINPDKPPRFKDVQNANRKEG